MEDVTNRLEVRRSNGMLNSLSVPKLDGVITPASNDQKLEARRGRTVQPKPNRGVHMSPR